MEAVSSGPKRTNKKARSLFFGKAPLGKRHKEDLPNDTREQSLPSSGSSGGKLLGPKDGAPLRGDAHELGPWHMMFEQTGTIPACRHHARHEGLGNESRWDCAAQATQVRYQTGRHLRVLRSGRECGESPTRVPSSPSLAVDRHAQLPCHNSLIGIVGFDRSGRRGLGLEPGRRAGQTARLAGCIDGFVQIGRKADFRGCSQGQPRHPNADHEANPHSGRGSGTQERARAMQ